MFLSDYHHFIKEVFLGLTFKKVIFFPLFFLFVVSFYRIGQHSDLCLDREVPGACGRDVNRQNRLT